jgi:mersacidin/lichenicidin family type 2 lantibiotic
MAYREIIRVRKNKEHRQRLSEEQPAVLPERPAGLMELADAELGAVQGAGGPALGLDPDLELH